MKKTRVLLLACACLLTVAATRPAKSDDCVIVHVCRDCDVITPTPESRLCTDIICTDNSVSETCGPCVLHCELPG